jgi:hypothetical protein
MMTGLPDLPGRQWGATNASRVLVLSSILQTPRWLFPHASGRYSATRMYSLALLMYARYQLNCFE